MMKDDLILLMPQLIVIVAGMALMLLEPFTAPGHKGRMGRIAVLAAAGAVMIALESARQRVVQSAGTKQRKPESRPSMAGLKRILPLD